MCTSQVQGGATNAASQWMNKLGLPRILTTSRQSKELLNNKHLLIITDRLVRTALDCCKDFQNLLTRKFNEIEDKESILSQIFFLQQ